MTRFFFPEPGLTDGVVVVRRVREDDIPAIVAACQDPLIKRFTSAITRVIGRTTARRTAKKTIAAVVSEISRLRRRMRSP